MTAVRFAQFILPALLACAHPQYAQNPAEADSLQLVISELAPDTNKVKSMLALGKIWHITQLDSAEAVLLRARALAIQLGYVKGEINAISDLGAVYQDRGDYSNAIDLYLDAIAIAEQHRLDHDVLEGFQRTLNLYFYLGHFAEAMRLATRGLAIGEKRNDMRLQAYYLNLIGFIYMRQGDTGGAEKYYTSYLQLAQQLRDSLTITDAYNNLAEVFTSTKDHAKALSHLQRSLNIYLRLYQRGELYQVDRIPYTYFKIGCAYKSQQNYPQALENCLAAIAYSERLPSNKYDIASYYIYTGDIYKELNRFNQALAYLRTGLSISRQIRHRENTRDAYNFLAQTFARTHRYDSAYHFQRLYDQLADSIVNEKSRLEIEQVMASYSLEKKDAEIAALTQQKLLSEAEASRERLTRNAMVIILVFSLALVYLLYTRYRLKQKNNFQLEMHRQQNNMFNAIAAVQDQERKRIAQDIHDTLGSILSTAKLRLSGMEAFTGRMHPHEKDHFQNVIGLLDEAVAELRNISQNIMPATLSRLGLVAALQNLFDRISSYSGIKIQYTVHGINGRLEEAVEIIIYRVVLELINNVVKHARASNVTVQLIQYSDHINVTVEDDGIGFDLAEARKRKNGIGLDNIVSRLEYLRGKIEIDTLPGQGTSIVMDFPLGAQVAN